MLKYQYASEGVGTVHYCAPEIKAQGKHNFSVDIWGLGLLLLEMLLGTSGVRLILFATPHPFCRPVFGSHT
jgi:serine/threonine protein kinase